MKISFIKTLMLLPLLAICVGAQVEGPSLAGNWFGTLEVGGAKLRLLLKVERSGDGYKAKMDSIDQGANDLPIDRIVLEGNKVTFSTAALGMNYEGTVDPKFESLVGTFKQGPVVEQLNFSRTVSAPKVQRRQDPAKPYPYDEEEVSYRNQTDNVKLAGTLTLPRDKTKRYPAVILISGSGSQDRNETIAGHHPFLVLADHLTRNGIAVLRMDDRGTGGSDTGRLDVTSENFMFDVLAGVEYLKSRKEIDPRKIGLIGHSEGGMIAPMAAARSKDIAFIVMLAGSGQRGEDLIYTQTELLQRAAGTDPETITRAIALFKDIHTIVKKETDKKRIDEQVNATIARHVSAMNDAQKKSFASIEASARQLMPMYSMPWYKYFISFDPAPTLKNVSVPVLALNGERDLQVGYKENLPLIESSLKAGKNKDVTVRSFPNLNHLFQTAMTGLPSEYGTLDETISPEVLQTISEWIAARTIKN